ncbi:MAG TPA: cytochrome c3 family protein [Polyangia bacterium]|jgi:predicted CXXCH cytochrome family protein
MPGRRSIVRSASIVAVSLALGLLLAAAPVRAANTCVTAKCHAKVGRAKHVHSAISGGDCTDCHQQVEKEKHKFKLAAKGNDLCLQCHSKPKHPNVHQAIDSGCTSCHHPHESAFPSLLREPTRKVCAGCHDLKGTPRHKPVAGGDCLKCHDPHSSPEKRLLRGGEAKACGSCHPAAKLMAAGPTQHRPVAQGRCTACHLAHGTTPKLLAKPINQLCLGCHSQKVNLKRRFVHEAVKSADCTSCHAPHASRVARLLRKPATKLCYDCHERKDKTTYVHGAVLLGRCAVCHDPHSADEARLLRARKEGDLCFKCHADDITGRKRIHKPVAEGACGRCHDPHGAATPRNLRKPQLELCGGCHPQAKPTGANVHAAAARGGCTACHDPHATANAGILKAKPAEVCAACHGQKDGYHVVAKLGGQPHPMAGKADPKHPGRALSCESCHVMVSSDYPKLWYSGQSAMEMCERCHGGSLTRPGIDKNADKRPAHTATKPKAKAK